MSEWIEFKKVGTSKTGKTNIWHVRDTTRHQAMAEIRWYGRWRRYALFPLGSTVYDHECLQAIADFCKTESKKARQKWQRKL
jgi:hypothetical protein